MDNSRKTGNCFRSLIILLSKMLIHWSRDMLPKNVGSSWLATVDRYTTPVTLAYTFPPYLSAPVCPSVRFACRHRNRSLRAVQTAPLRFCCCFSLFSGQSAATASSLVPRMMSVLEVNGYCCFRDWKETPTAVDASLLSCLRLGCSSTPGNAAEQQLLPPRHSRGPPTTG